MRRRTRGRRELTAEQVAAIYEGAAKAGDSVEIRNDAINTALAEYGYSPLDAIRARFWIGRGKPAAYLWEH